MISRQKKKLIDKSFEIMMMNRLINNELEKIGLISNTYIQCSIIKEYIDNNNIYCEFVISPYSL